MRTGLDAMRAGVGASSGAARECRTGQHAVWNHTRRVLTLGRRAQTGCSGAPSAICDDGMVSALHGLHAAVLTLAQILLRRSPAPRSRRREIRGRCWRTDDGRIYGLRMRSAPVRPRHRCAAYLAVDRRHCAQRPRAKCVCPTTSEEESISDRRRRQCREQRTSQCAGQAVRGPAEGRRDEERRGGMRGRKDGMSESSAEQAPYIRSWVDPVRT